MKELSNLLNDAVNVYRTRKYIVKQILVIRESPTEQNILFSEDTFYKRTKTRDKEYNIIFKDKGNIDGKRLPSTSYSRRYVN